MKGGPTFLCIGAQKAGTTWLWENLLTHPQLWLPLVKELHWFDVRYPPALCSNEPHYQHKRGLSRYRPLWRRPSLTDAAWLWRLYHRTRDDCDYLALFDRRDHRLSGEVTPAYSTLDAHTVRSIHGLLRTDCRILFLMREPVARLWSSVSMDCRMRGLDPHTLDETVLEALSRSPGMVLRSDYARTLEHWSVFGDRLGLFYYEDLVLDPVQFLRDVLTFLGVDATWKSKQVHRIHNAGGSSSGLSPALAERWRDRYAPMVAAVAERIGRVPAAWHRQQFDIVRTPNAEHGFGASGGE